MVRPWMPGIVGRVHGARRDCVADAFPDETVRESEVMALQGTTSWVQWLSLHVTWPRGACVIPAKTQGLGFHPVELTPNDLAPGAICYRW